jgi:hypothetical protein
MIARYADPYDNPSRSAITRTDTPPCRSSAACSSRRARSPSLALHPGQVGQSAYDKTSARSSVDANCATSRCATCIRSSKGTASSGDASRSTTRTSIPPPVVDTTCTQPSTPLPLCPPSPSGALPAPPARPRELDPLGSRPPNVDAGRAVRMTNTIRRKNRRATSRASADESGPFRARPVIGRPRAAVGWARPWRRATSGSVSEHPS